MTSTFIVRGFKVRTQSHFCFQIIAVRTESETYTDWRGEEKTIPAGAKILGRSDNLETARKRAATMRRGQTIVIVDRTTGEEV